MKNMTPKNTNTCKASLNKLSAGIGVSLILIKINSLIMMSYTNFSNKQEKAIILNNSSKS